MPNGALVLKDVQSSNGVRPNSLAVYRNMLFVTNVGDQGLSTPANVTGFWVSNDGQLTPITGSTNNLSANYPQPTCIVFSRDGSQLAVSELNTNHISIFNVNADGTLNGPFVNDSSGSGPFGSVFLFSGPLLVTEAATDALSSYFVRDNGTLNTISPSVLNGQAATCWVALSRNEEFAYTTNAGSGTISIYRIFPNGILRLAGIVYSNRCDLAAPIDEAVSQDGRYLFVLNGNQGTITEFLIRDNGFILIPVNIISNPYIPEVGAQGMAVI
jgi:6-phosphogluconolactonase (cycloisomerase 2 family)